MIRHAEGGRLNALIAALSALASMEVFLQNA
jgi:hypothetical protein